MLQNLLIDGKREIERAISWQGLELNVVFNIKKIIKSENEQDLEKLNNFFGKELIIKN